MSKTLCSQVDVFNREGRLVAQQGADMWNSSVVKMPCSPWSSMVKPGGAFKVRLTPCTWQRWAEPVSHTSSVSCLQAAAPARRWEVISKQLGALARKTAASAEDVEVKKLATIT